MAAAWPLLLTPDPASAAVNHDNQTATLTFVDNDDMEHTCVLYDNSTHDTDDPNHPTLSVTTGTFGSPDPDDPSCFASLEVTLVYKDQEGTVRQSTASGIMSNPFGGTTVTVDGAYSATTTSVTAYFFFCDPNQSASCSATVTTAPK